MSAATKTAVAVRQIVLVDLSSIAYPIWHMSQSEPNANHASEQIVGRIRSIAQGQPHVAICCDAGRSFRRDLDPLYKANRPERDERLHHQIKLAVEQLREDGFPIWSVPGFEADDLIATAAMRAFETTEAEVIIVSGDKDLLQLVGDRIVAQSVKDGSRLDETAVAAKFGATPAQMRDYLTLVGDASDNIKGVEGIGGKRAADLLAKFGSVDHLFAQLHEKGGKAIGLTPAIAANLLAFYPHLDATRTLITLRTDAEIPFEDVLSLRVSKPSTHQYATTTMTDYDDEDPMPEQTETPVTTIEPSTPTNEPASTAMTVRQPELAPMPAEYEKQLDPRSLKQAQALAFDMWKSGMFSAYGTPEAVLSTVLVGREMGIPAMTALRTIHNIKGRHALSAQLIVAMVLRSGLAEYFEVSELTNTSCTYVTKRKNGRGEISVTHTIEMARTAGLVKEDSGWMKNPQDMLSARASVRLARLVYPDICANVYTPDELAEIRGEAA
jgi:5'-3' exonuclease